MQTPLIDKALQHRYEKGIPNCDTQTVFIKHLNKE